MPLVKAALVARLPALHAGRGSHLSVVPPASSHDR